MRNLRCPSQFTKPRTYVNLRDAIFYAPGKLARRSLRTKLAMHPPKRRSLVDDHISMARFFRWTEFWKELG